MNIFMNCSYYELFRFLAITFVLIFDGYGSRFDIVVANSVICCKQAVYMFRWLHIFLVIIVAQMPFIPVTIDANQRFAAIQARFVVKVDGRVVDTIRLGCEHLWTVLAKEK